MNRLYSADESHREHMRRVKRFKLGTVFQSQNTIMMPKVMRDKFDIKIVSFHKEILLLEMINRDSNQFDAMQKELTMLEKLST